MQSLNLDAVMNQTFVPDYSVRAITDVFYIAIKRTLYLAAKRATLMEKSKRFGSELGSNEPIDYEVEKVRELNDLNEFWIPFEILFAIYTFAAIAFARRR